MMCEDNNNIFLFSIIAADLCGMQYGGIRITTGGRHIVEHRRETDGNIGIFAGESDTECCPRIISFCNTRNILSFSLSLSSLFIYFFHFYSILNLSLTLSFLINCNRIVNTVFKDINGLVHFIHINRSNGRVIAPIIDVDSRRGSLIKQQVIIIRLLSYIRPFIDGPIIFV